MKIIVFGCGRIGTCILDRLLPLNHDITAIDTNASVIDKIEDTKDVMAVCADAANFHVLEDVGVKTADVVIACTNLNEVNLSVCSMAKKLGAKHTIAQVRKPDYTIADFRKVEELFDIDYIYNPDLETASRIYQMINPVEVTRQNHYRQMNVMLMGASKVSVHLCRLLDRANCSVKLLEKNISRCERMCELVPESVYVTCADGTEKTVLYEEGIERTDAFVALTDLDEQNLLISVFAKSRKVPMVITKVKHNSFESLVGGLGLDNILAPKMIAADSVVSYIEGIK